MPGNDLRGEQALSRASCGEGCQKLGRHVTAQNEAAVGEGLHAASRGQPGDEECVVEGSGDPEGQPCIGARELCKSSPGDDTSGAQNSDAVGEVLDIGQEVRREQDARALPRAFSDEVQQSISALEVDASRGLVQDQEPGFGDECSGKLHPLLLASRQAAVRRTHPRIDAHLLQECRRVAWAAVELGEVGDPGQGTGGRGQATGLQHGPHARPSGRVLRAAPHEAHAALGRPAKTEGGLEGGGLACPIGAQEGHHPSSRDLQAHVIHGGPVPVAHHEVLKGQGDHGATVGADSICHPCDLRNNGVVNFRGQPGERVARTLLAGGPATATELAQALSMTAAGVRRILTQLMADGLVEAHDRAPYGPAPKPRRGRPSSVYALTDSGRAACDQAYDDLALSALRFMATTYGPAAVEEFAAARAAGLASAMRTAHDAQGIAEALTAAGYPAEVEPLGDVAVQLCQHNCPVVDAAREFPVLCDAETTAIGDVLGLHVTRLATLAHGDQVCTTVIPLATGRASA